MIKMCNDCDSLDCEKRESGLSCYFKELEEDDEE